MCIRISGGRRDIGECEVARVVGRWRSREDHWAGETTRVSELKKTDLLTSSSSLSEREVVDCAGDWLLYIMAGDKDCNHKNKGRTNSSWYFETGGTALHTSALLLGIRSFRIFLH